MSAYLPASTDAEARSFITRRTVHAARHQPCVYFIGTSPGLVKIGKCSGHPEQRLGQLQTGCPTPLKLIVFTIGDTRFERELHRIFAKHRISPRSEWFRLEGDLLEYVRDMVSLARQGDAAHRETRKRIAKMVAALPAQEGA